MTGATPKKGKTNIYGIGIRKEKIDWPIPWLSTSDSNLKSLGIIFSNNYHQAVEKNWENIMNAVEKRSKLYKVQI